MISRSFLVISMIAVAAYAAVPTAAIAGNGSANGATPPQRHYKTACGLPSPMSLSCDAAVVTADSGQPLTGSAPPAGSYGPVQFHTGYNLPCMPGGPVQSLCSTPSKFGGQTIAIVDAYADPNIESDLAVYDQQYGLPPCTQKNGCLTIHNMCSVKGVNRNQCFTDQGWALETSLDVEVAHAVCQTCKILYVESAYGDWTNMGNAENWAAQNGATEISNSWAGSEFTGETQYDSYWNHPGIAVVFASGDSDYGALYPATSPTVLAVGGTTLTLNLDSSYGGETVWSNGTNGTGSGCSAYEPAPSWQKAMTNWSATGCGSMRASTDVSADADPATGAAVYDSFGYNGTTGWYQVGGTSLAAPIVSAIIALAGGASGYSNPSQLPYAKANASGSHDVTAGSNGTCGTIMCAAGAGYDGPTGLGTPSGTAGL